MYSFLSFYFILLGSINFLSPRLLVYLSRDSFSLVASVCFPFSSVCSIPPSIFYSSGLIAMNTLVYTCYRMFLFFLQLQKIALLYVGIEPDIVFWSLKYIVLWLPGFLKFFLISLFWFRWDYLCMILCIFIWFSCFSCSFACSVYLTIF